MADAVCSLTHPIELDVPDVLPSAAEAGRQPADNRFGIGWVPAIDLMEGVRTLACWLAYEADACAPPSPGSR
jgi:hypothetical protein